ncbi:MAG TPA: efflux RND transporter periplasmic adaptor subunit [Desulfatirhabdiaceae bacterium]|nr:efflux RND transporter periplasmic adaptor subunit [Desulfatirhabdiaceae bacterium]
MAFVDKRYKWFLVVIISSALVGWAIFNRLDHKSGSRGLKDALESVPVQVASVQRGPIELRRMFSGTLVATAEFGVAPKVGGRVESLVLDLSDPVNRGQEVARLDDDEYVQAVAQARADLAVAKANLSQAKSALEIATRELSRVKTLSSRGVASESQLDVVLSNQLQKKAGLEVAEAQQVRAEAFLETANIKLGYTRVTADWTGGDKQRVVAERHIDEGNTVSANAPLLTIVELDPITGVIFITEKDYIRLKTGQSVALLTDAFPEETFIGHITRIAPVFNQATRQARVEMTIQNPAHRLKPGMFIRAVVVLDRVADAVIVPEQALTRRGDRTGVFLVANGSRKAIWKEVKEGIREDDRVQVNGENLSGRVVILGQQLLDDGTAVTIPEDQTAKDGDAE